MYGYDYEGGALNPRMSAWSEALKQAKEELGQGRVSRERLFSRAREIIGVNPNPVMREPSGKPRGRPRVSAPVERRPKYTQEELVQRRRERMAKKREQRRPRQCILCDIMEEKGISERDALRIAEREGLLKYPRRSEY